MNLSTIGVIYAHEHVCVSAMKCVHHLLGAEVDLGGAVKDYKLTIQFRVEENGFVGGDHQICSLPCDGVCVGFHQFHKMVCGYLIIIIGC